MAKDFGARPSALLGISELWWQFQFDRVIFIFGRRTQSRLDQRTKKGKPKWTLEQALEDQPQTGLLDKLIMSTPIEDDPMI